MKKISIFDFQAKGAPALACKDLSTTRPRGSPLQQSSTPAMLCLQTTTTLDVVFITDIAHQGCTLFASCPAPCDACQLLALPSPVVSGAFGHSPDHASLCS